MERYHKIRKYANGVLLIVFIGVVVLLNITTPDKTFSEEENRMLEQKPGFSLDQLFKGRFTSNYEKYIADQFVSRDFWVGVKSDSELAVGKRENNNIYVGKDGYLFEAFTKPSEISFKEKMETVNSLASLAPKLNTYFMLVPNSVKVLEDKLPKNAPVDDELHYLNKVKEALDKNIKFIDVYDTLYSKRDEYIYYRTDHHWTTRAAFYAYQKLASEMGFTPNGEDNFNVTRVADNFYGTLYSRGGFRHVKPDSIEIYTPKSDDWCSVEYDNENKVSNSLYNMESLEKKDKYTVFLGGNHPLAKISSKSPSGRKLLIFKDSYTNCLVPFLDEHFTQIFMVDPRYYDGDLAELINENKIKDVLILYNVNTFFEDVSIDNIYENIEKLSYYGVLNNETEVPSARVEDTGDSLAADEGSKAEDNGGNTIEKAQVNYREVFKDSVFLGDSISEGLSYYGLLDESRVFTKVGASIISSKGQVDKIAGLKPKNIFLLYGINDLSGSTPVERFVGRYTEVIKYIKTQLPESGIYIQSILPVQSFVEKRRPELSNSIIKEYNEGLKKMAMEENINFADIASLLNESNTDLYEGDGIHFRPGFDKLWLDYLYRCLAP